MTRSISDSLLMPDVCFVALAKSGKSLNTWVQLIDFLKPWYAIAKHADNILLCLQKNSLLPLSLDPNLDISLNLPFKTQKRPCLKLLEPLKS